MWTEWRYQYDRSSRRSTKSLKKELEHHGSGQATRRKQIFTSVLPNKRFPDSLFHHSSEYEHHVFASIDRELALEEQELHSLGN